MLIEACRDANELGVIKADRDGCAVGFAVKVAVDVFVAERLAVAVKVGNIPSRTSDRPVDG